MRNIKYAKKAGIAKPMWSNTTQRYNERSRFIASRCCQQSGVALLFDLVDNALAQIVIDLKTNMSFFEKRVIASRTISAPSLN
jgi:hypothetical protein